MDKRYTEKEEKSIEAYKMFSTQEGRLVLNDLEKYCNFSKTTKDMNSNIEEMVFKEGKRAVFIHIKKKLDKANINIYDLLK